MGIWKQALDTYTVYRSTANFAFSFEEIMRLPIFMINEAYQQAEKEFERKSKTMTQQPQSPF